MKTREAIQARINELLADERLQEPPADVTINAPLALIQVAIKNEIIALRWVLDNASTQEETG